jgi:ribonuclease E
VGEGEGRGEHDGERRRRRRGRRGGRRNRRGREGDGLTAQNGDGEQDDRQPHEQHGVESEVADAVADLGGPSQAEAPAESAQPAPQPFEPMAREPDPPARQGEPAAAAEAPAPAETSRRRSTVREAAPIFSSGAMSDVQPAQEALRAPAPSPEPAVTAPEPAAADPPAEAKPRRFGWWNRRG